MKSMMLAAFLAAGGTAWAAVAAGSEAQEAAVANRLEQVLLGFRVEGMALGDKAEEAAAKLQAAGFRLVKRGKFGGNASYQFQKQGGRARSTVFLITDEKGAVSEIRYVCAVGTACTEGKAEKRRVEQVFAPFESLCKWTRGNLWCRGFSDTRLLQVNIRFQRGRIIYQLKAADSYFAQQAAQRRKAQQERKAREERERLAAIAERERQMAEAEARRKEQARKDAEAKRRFLASVAGHPCEKPDLGSAKSMIACMERLEKDLQESGRQTAVFLRRGSCEQMQKALANALQARGFRGEQVSRRIPGCGVLADVFHLKTKRKIYWHECRGKPRSQDLEYVYKCLDFDRVSWIACSNIRGLYIDHLRAAGMKIDGSNYREHRLDCEFVPELREMKKKRIARARYQRKQAQEAALRKKLDELFYTDTSERRRSRYSEAEWKMMRDGKVVVPAGYGPPGAEEIRRAVMRSMVERRKQQMGEYDKYSTPVMVDGRRIYFRYRGYGMQVKFADVTDVSCEARQGSGGYLCRYRLKSEAKNTVPWVEDMRNPFNAWVVLFEDYLSFSYSRRLTDWFVLTEEGWKQPYTEDQLAAIEALGRHGQRRIQQRTSRPRGEEGVVEQAVGAGADYFYAQGVGHAMKAVFLMASPRLALDR